MRPLFPVLYSRTSARRLSEFGTFYSFGGRSNQALAFLIRGFAPDRVPMRHSGEPMGTQALPVPSFHWIS